MEAGEHMYRLSAVHDLQTPRPFVSSVQYLDCHSIGYHLPEKASMAMMR